jgi:cytochrome P450
VLSELKEKCFKDSKTMYYDKVSDLEYFMTVFNETLRLDPPVIFSSLMVVNEPTEINGINVNTKDNLLVNLH